MGDELKACPACAEQIQVAAVVCRHCKYDFRVGAVPAAPAKGGATKVVVIVVAIVLLVPCVLGVLAALLLPAIARATRNAKLTGCVNNLSQLWKMQHHYMVSYGGREKLMPTETGGQFWLRLTTVNPPLIDATLTDIFACPLNGTPPGAGSTHYRGPNGNVNKFEDGDAVGADKVGNHGANEGGNVLRRSGDVQVVAESDPMWRRAAETTSP